MKNRKSVAMAMATLPVTALLMAGSVAGDNPAHVLWQTPGMQSDSAGIHYVQRITLTGRTDMQALAFNQFARKAKMLNPADTLVEIVPGYYAIRSSRFGAGLDSIVFEIDTRGRLVNSSYAPDGFHGVMADGTLVPVVYTRQPLTRPQQWQAGKVDEMPYGPKVYDWNESLLTDYAPGVYDIVPSFSKIDKTLTGASMPITSVHTVIDSVYAVDRRPNHAELTVHNGTLTIHAASARAAATAQRVFEAKVLRPDPERPLPPARLVFDPDFEWRGMMIDVARNFQTVETLEDILELMADNGLNKLHLHAVDDEAWRLEMPSLPELTAVGSRRGWGTDEHDHLYQIFTGDGNPDNPEGTSNGYYTREQLVGLLRKARDLGIDVVPEIESPGHARAAIRAMERRAADGDASYRLIHDGDTSRYTSAQAFHDNVMNPALESTYKFMTTVIDDIIGLYREADVPLIGIHIGGDEVARGAWDGSAVARQFMADNGIADQHGLHAYFVRRIAAILKERGVPMYGWQEIALGHGPEYDAEIAPLVGGVNCWSTIVGKGTKPVPVQSVEGGYPTILSNVEHFYFDLSYSAHPEEKGLNWGGHVNEFTAFDGYANKLCPAPADAAGKVIGVNAHCFAETMRNPDQLLMYLTPKIFGLAERAAHPDTTYTVAEFNRIVGDKELPALQARYAANGRGVVHINQPGIKVIDGKVTMNTPYTGGEIRYTTDGTEPTSQSALYTAPFGYTDGMDVRARYFRNGTMSVTTYLGPQ